VFFEELVHALIEKDRDARIGSAEKLVRILEQDEESAWWRVRAKEIRSATRRPLRRCKIRRQTAIYGRDPELTQLVGIFGKVKEGKGQVVLVEGETGIGKTRLVDEFVGRLQREGEELNFLFGANSPGGQTSAPSAFATAFREHFVSAGLEETLQEYLPESPLLIPAFAALLRGDATQRGVERLTKESLESVFVQATRALAAERPTVILIDDLQFAPGEGRALFAALTLAISRHPVLLVGTMRHDVSREWVAGILRSLHASHLVLGRLEPRDTSKLLVDAFRSRHLADSLAPRIYERSDGNPFFVFEILRGLREGEKIERRADGTWSQTAEIPDIKIPSTVRELIETQMGDLDADDVKLLKVASCCGYEFDPHLVGHVLSLRDVKILKMLGRLERTKRMVRSLGRNFVFDHHQVQALLYEGLDDSARERIHAALGHALERREGTLEAKPAELDGALCVDLCQHFSRGGEGKRAMRYVGRALNHLWEACRHDEAIELTDRLLATEGLLEGRRRAAVLLRQVSPLDVLGLRTRQKAALDEALRLADASGDPMVRARVRTALGWLFYNQSSHARACRVLEDAVELAKAAEDLRVEARARGNLGNSYVALGRFDEARKQHERRLACMQERGDRRGEAAAIGNLGQVAFARGSYDEALELHQSDLEICRSIEFRLGEAIATGNLGATLFALGRARESVDTFRLCLSAAREIGFRRGETLARLHMGEVEAALGSLEAARENVETAGVLAEEIEDPAIEGEALRVMGDVLMLAGAKQRAEHFHRAALAKLRDISAPPRLVRALVALGRLLVWTDSPADAQAQFTKALEFGREIDTPNEIVLSAAQLARLPGGDAALAAETFSAYESRLAHVPKMEARMLLWHATADLAHLTAAADLLETLTANSATASRDPMVRSVPLYREIAAAWREHGR
jgi:tetratricopeptide (TPR) repeat protein